MRLALFFLIFVMAAVAVDASGIGAAPSQLNFNVEKEKRQQRELTVYNLEDAQAEFSVDSESTFLGFYHEGMIEPEGAAKIIVEADASGLKEGTHYATIVLITSENSEGVSLNVGTAIKATVNVFSSRKTNVATGILISSAIACIGLLLYFAALRLPFLKTAKS